MTHPVIAMWHAAGEPVEVPASLAGTCALTGVEGPIVPFREVVSDNFSAWDRLPFRHGSTGFSLAACWSFRHRPLRSQPHVQLGDTLTLADPATLRRALSRALGPHVAVSVPIGRQKHVAPFARWGQVATDNENVPWLAADGDRLDFVAMLRRLGFGEAALTEPTPRWQLLRRLDARERLDALQAWDILADWRRHTIYLDIACRATRTPKETANG